MKCFEIEHNFSLHYLNDHVKVGPCCISKHQTVDKTFPILQQPYLDNLKILNRQDILTETCQACINHEQLGAGSRRIDQLEFYKDWKRPGIRGIDVHLGNLCNLACVICGPHDSTAWHQDAKHLRIPILPEYQYQKHDQFDISWLADLENLEMVHFWGGEPLMSGVHLDFMNALDRKGVLSRCRIIYNTNGTHTVDDAVLDAWSRSHLVELYFSIDDINERFEYQRYGAKWQKLMDNLKWFQNMPINNFMFYINTVWSMLNVYYLPELMDWKDTEFSETRFKDKINLFFAEASGRCRLMSLPTIAAELLTEKLKRFPELKFVINSLSNRDDEIVSFRDYINRLDVLRGKKYSDSHPEWGQVLGL